MEATKTLSFKVAKPSPLPEPFPVTVAIPVKPLWSGHPDYPSIVNMATKYASTGYNQWGYGPGSWLLIWIAQGKTDNALRDRALGDFRKLLTSLVNVWNAKGNVTSFSGDSYLYAGDLMETMVTVDNWCHDLLTHDERAQIKMLCEQCIFNIWNPSKANWNGATYTWSGWATNNPWNNYFFRTHFRATVLWAIHSQNPTWLAKVNDLIQLTKTKYAYLEGGGSLEGTGYGSGIWNLFQTIWLLREVGVVDLTLDCRVPEFLDYWVNAFTPGLGSVAQFGDTPATSWKDPHKAILIWGILLAPNTPQAERARWVITQKGLKNLRPEYLFLTTYDTTGTITQPTFETYHAKGVGHLFARDMDGTYLTVDCKTAVESHDHLSEGEVQIYKNGWIFVTANIASHSGIVQTTKEHNCLVFYKSDGVTLIPLRRSSTAVNTMTYSDDGNILIANCDLTPCYSGTPVTSYTRKVTWNRSLKKVSIEDAYTGDVKAMWHGYVTALPTYDNGVISNAKLTIKPLVACDVGIIDMYDYKPSEWMTAARCWRLQLTNFTNSMGVEIQVL